MKTESRTIELARAGTANNGVVLTDTDLSEIEETFPKIVEAPVTVGHPKSQLEPKVGSVRKVWKSGSKLFGVVEIVSAFAENIRAGFYDQRSIGIARNYEGKHFLHHLAILGAVPPAIKGMPSLSLAFSDTPNYYHFAEPESEPEEDPFWPTRPVFEWDGGSSYTEYTPEEKDLIEVTFKL